MAIKSTTSKPKVATSKPARKAEHPSSRQASSARKPEAKHDGFCKSVELKEERDKARKAGESNRPHTEKDTNSVEEPNGQKAAGDSPETRELQELKDMISALKDSLGEKQEQASPPSSGASPSGGEQSGGGEKSPQANPSNPISQDKKASGDVNDQLMGLAVAVLATGGQNPMAGGGLKAQLSQSYQQAGGRQNPQIRQEVHTLVSVALGGGNANTFQNLPGNAWGPLGRGFGPSFGPANGTPQVTFQVPLRF